jgi:hypothetical protein
MKPEHILMSTLRFALSMKRPHGSREEGRLLASLMHPSLAAVSHVDICGNLHIDMRVSHKKHRTLFVAHVDTVHRSSGKNKFDDSKPMWTAADGQPLGADDGAGVAMLAGLMAAKVPGYYLFTRGEERGGIGASYVAERYEKTLANMDRAIAFDRKDVFSVITHQSRGRCCSDAFAEALSEDLNARGLMYMPDDSGVYTDTAEFVDLIPECTNLSVGYYGEHTPNERLDTDHLLALFRAAVDIKWDLLPVQREPGDDGFDEHFALTSAAEAKAEREFWSQIAAQNKADAALAEQLNDPFYVNDNPFGIRRIKQ